MGSVDLKSFQELFIEEVTQLNSGSPELKNLITPVGRLDKEKTLEVYRSDYYARLTEAMGSTFEACWVLLGDDDFFKFTREFIRKNPSTSTDLGCYGEAFISRLEDIENELELTGLNELARFEWKFWQIFHLAKKEKQGSLPSGEKELMDLNLKDKDFYLFNASFDFYDVWLNRENADYFLEKTFEDFAGERFVLLAHSVSGPFHEPIGESDFRALSMLQKGLSLGETIQEVPELHHYSPSQWSSFFNILSTIL